MQIYPSKNTVYFEVVVKEKRNNIIKLLHKIKYNKKINNKL